MNIFQTPLWYLGLFLTLRKKWDDKEISTDQVLKEMRNAIYGMDADEAVTMFHMAGWKQVEVIPADAEYYHEGPYVADRMRIWIKDDKVVRAVAG